MTRTVHLIVGPSQHGVCRHALQIADALGHDTVRIERPADFVLATVSKADVVHIPYTDRLFAKDCEESAAAFLALVQPLIAAGQAVSVTLHDLPAGNSDLELRRKAAYAKVVDSARGVVVNSGLELELLDQFDEHARSRRKIPIPVPHFPPAAAERGSDVVVLGFVFPDRGYEHTIAELADGVDLLALGGPSVGHENLPDKLAALAAQHGHTMRTTGFVADEDLPLALAQAAVPVAPNRRVAASASIATWIGHGRRPLVPDSPYARELDTEWPGTIRLYDADEPGALHSAIQEAQHDPSLTYIDADVRRGPTVDDVAAAYADHFDATAPDQLMSVGPNRWAVPANRWDLLDRLQPPEAPSVSVVIPYFEAQAELDRVLAALAIQTHPSSRLQVIVADDGSSSAPDLSAAGDLETAVVRQDNRGFRAAAARNLGAKAADGEVLLFLDGDTSPEPDYIRLLSRLPALAPDILAVGRRRHADFTQDPPVELAEPGWLVDAYQRSQNLAVVDERSYRFVISAVMAMHRDLFNEVGGFSEEFSSYGGEDWELAHRAYVAGAVLTHVRDAVAWHDGPEWASRELVKDKNEETFALACLLPDSVERGGGQWLPYPAVAIRLRSDDPFAVLATARSAFATNADCGFWVDHPATVERVGDPRIRVGEVPADVRARALVVADIVPGDLGRLPKLIEEALQTGRLTTPAGIFTAARARNRSRRWNESAESSDLVGRLFGARELAWPKPYGNVDLHHELKQTYEATKRRA